MLLHYLDLEICELSFPYKFAVVLLYMAITLRSFLMIKRLKSQIMKPLSCDFKSGCPGASETFYSRFSVNQGTSSHCWLPLVNSNFLDMYCLLFRSSLCPCHSPFLGAFGIVSTVIDKFGPPQLLTSFLWGLFHEQ